MSLLNDRVAAALNDAQISTKELVQATKTTRATIAKWKRGESISISAENLFFISEATGVPMEWFITGKMPASKETLDGGMECPKLQTHQGTAVYKVKAPFSLRSIDMNFIKLETAPFTFENGFFTALEVERENCVLVQSDTDSMSPVIQPGDWILLEKSSSVLDSKIYLVAFPQASFARIYKLTLKSKGGFICVPANGNCPTEDVAIEDLQNNRVIVLGRIVCRIGKL